MSAPKGVVLGILLTLSLPVLAQKSLPKNMVMADNNPFHFGYSVGINTAGLTMVPHDGYTFDLNVNQTHPGKHEFIPGININLITDYRLSKFLNLRFLPGMQLSSRALTVINNTTSASETWNIESIYVDLPLLLKYRADRVNNYAPYLIVGVNPRVDVQGSIGKKFQKATRFLRPYDLFIELGVGVDFYIPMAKIATELKFCVGMFDMLPKPGDFGYKLDDPLYGLYASAVDQVFSRLVVFAIHVEQSR